MLILSNLSNPIEMSLFDCGATLKLMGSAVAAAENVMLSFVQLVVTGAPKELVPTPISTEYGVPP